MNPQSCDLVALPPTSLVERVKASDAVARSIHPSCSALATSTAVPTRPSPRLMRRLPAVGRSARQARTRAGRCRASDRDRGEQEIRRLDRSGAQELHRSVRRAPARYGREEARSRRNGTREASLPEGRQDRRERCGG